MKKIYATLAGMAMMILTFMISCQKQEIMMSEGKISEQISYTWTKQFTPAETEVTWQFSEGKIYIRQNETMIGQGTYTIDCSVTKAKIKIDGFTGGNDYMNVTWQVLQLDNKVFAVTNMSKGTQEYEFVRKD